MRHLAHFLDKYDTIVFDMDGVVTSEQSYWTSAALTVWERLFPNKYSVEEIEENADQIRKKVFCSDELILILKNKGVNSNWDLCYIVYAMCKILDTTDFVKVMAECSKMRDNIIDEYPIITRRLSDITGIDCSRNSAYWNDVVMSFQEWALGDELFEKTYGRKPKVCGKSGLILKEKPIIDGDKLKEVFAALSESGKRLATATGRLYNEIITPLKDFGILSQFADDGIITYSNIQNAEINSGKDLAKPHPYIFLKAIFGENYPDEKILNKQYDSEKVKKTLIVGDAGADILAAKATEADFCAVLTGVSGEKARAYFENLNAEYILPSLADFLV